MTDPLETLRRIAADEALVGRDGRAIRDLAAAVRALHERQAAPIQVSLERIVASTDAAAEARGYRRGLETAANVASVPFDHDEIAAAIRALIPGG